MQVCRSLQASVLKIFGDFGSLTSPTSEPTKKMGRQSKAAPLLVVPRLSWAPLCCHGAGNCCGQRRSPSVWMACSFQLSAILPPPFPAQHSSSPWPLLASSEGRQHFLPVPTWYLLFASRTQAVHPLHNPIDTLDVAGMWDTTQLGELIPQLPPK